MIQIFENLLRSVISIVLGSSDNTNFNISEERIIKWKAKRELEKKKFNGVLYENRIIYYSDFYDLNTIIDKNWLKFKDVFHNKKRFTILFEEIETYRNTLAHGRQLTTYQEDLLKGIVGDLKTKIIFYHNKNMNAEDYFINILKVTDSFGNTWENNMVSSIGLNTNQILKVGDTIEIFIDAYDPKGREIIYSIEWEDLNLSNLTGKFQINITKKMIRKSSDLRIKVETEEIEYKNYTTISFFYTVLP